MYNIALVDIHKQKKNSLTSNFTQIFTFRIEMKHEHIDVTYG